MALALVGCESLPWAQADNEADLAKIDLLNQQLARESELERPDPCQAIHYPGDDASSLAHAAYYVAVTACTSGSGGPAQPAVPASVQIAEEFADAEKAKAKTGLARARIWMDGILGVLGVAKDLHIAEEARESAERIADREAETPPDGSVWVQGGGQYVVHTDSHNDSSDRRSNFDNDQSDRRSDYANDKADRRVTDSHNDNSDHSVTEDNDVTTTDNSDHSVTEDNDVTTTDHSDHSVREDNDSTSTTTSDSHNQDNDVTTTTDNRIHEDNDVTLTTGDGGFVEHYGGNAQVEKGSPPIVPPGDEETEN